MVHLCKTNYMKHDLRKVTVRSKPGTIEIKGFFHQWFTKVFDDGESFLEAVVEKEDGVIETYREDSYEIKFINEDDTMSRHRPGRNRP